MALQFCARRTWRDRRRLWVAYGYVLLQVGLLCLFFVTARHRAPLLGMLALFAAAGAMRNAPTAAIAMAIARGLRMRTSDS